MEETTTVPMSTDMDGVNTISSNKALQPLLDMAKEYCSVKNNASVNVGMIRTLILKALSDSNIFNGFDQIKYIVEPALKSTAATTTTGAAAEGDVLLQTLDLFSYGTYHDYCKHNTSTTKKYLTLTESQVYKLRQLTVVSLVQQACSPTIAANNVTFPPTGKVSYDVLARELGFNGTNSNEDVTMTDHNNNNQEVLDPTNTIEALRQVEDMLISCIYAGVISGQLCQKHKVFIVHSSSTSTSEDGTVQLQYPCRPRDVSPMDEIPNLLKSLSALQYKLRSSQDIIQKSKLQAQQNKQVDSQYWNNVQDKISMTIKTMLKSSGGRGGGGGGTTATISSSSFAAAASSEGSSGTGTGAGTRSRNQSSSTNRQTKRSRGGFGGALSEAFGRY